MIRELVVVAEATPPPALDVLFSLAVAAMAEGLACSSVGKVLSAIGISARTVETGVLVAETAGVVVLLAADLPFVESVGCNNTKAKENAIASTKGVPINIRCEVCVSTEFCVKL